MQGSNKELVQSVMRQATNTPLFTCFETFVRFVAKEETSTTTIYEILVSFQQCALSIIYRFHPLSAFSSAGLVYDALVA